MTEHLETTDTRGSLGNTDRFEEGSESFRRAKELGIRGVWRAVHPGTGQTMDAADFGADVRRRHELGIEPFGFWKAELPPVEE